MRADRGQRGVRIVVAIEAHDSPVADRHHVCDLGVNVHVSSGHARVQRDHDDAALAGVDEALGLRLQRGPPLLVSSNHTLTPSCPR